MLKRVIGVVGMLGYGSLRGRHCEGILQMWKRTCGVFSSSKRFTAQEIPQRNMQIRYSSTTLGEQQVDYFRTEGSLSIVEKGLQNATQSSQLYALKLKCSACKGESIRSFTKRAYHKGLVMVRCGSCEKLHLVADKLGWLHYSQADSTTLEDGEQPKGHDPVAVVRFIREVFGQGRAGAKMEQQRSIAQKVE